MSCRSCLQNVLQFLVGCKELGGGPLRVPWVGTTDCDTKSTSELGKLYSYLFYKYRENYKNNYCVILKKTFFFGCNFLLFKNLWLCLLPSQVLLLSGGYFHDTVSSPNTWYILLFTADVCSFHIAQGQTYHTEGCKTSDAFNA